MSRAFACSLMKERDIKTVDPCYSTTFNSTVYLIAMKRKQQIMWSRENVRGTVKERNANARIYTHTVHICVSWGVGGVGHLIALVV